MSHAISAGNKRKKQKTEKLLSYPILCTLCHLYQRNKIKTNLSQLRIYFNIVCQVHISEKKASEKRGHLISQVHNIEVKWSIKPCSVRIYFLQVIDRGISGVDNEKTKCA